MPTGENVEELSIDFTLSLKYPEYLQDHHTGIHRKKADTE